MLPLLKPCSLSIVWVTVLVCHVTVTLAQPMAPKPGGNVTEPHPSAPTLPSTQPNPSTKPMTSLSQANIQVTTSQIGMPSPSARTNLSVAPSMSSTSKENPSVAASVPLSSSQAGGPSSHGSSQMYTSMKGPTTTSGNSQQSPSKPPSQSSSPTSKSSHNSQKPLTTTQPALSRNASHQSGSITSKMIDHSSGQPLNTPTSSAKNSLGQPSSPRGLHMITPPTDSFSLPLSSGLFPSSSPHPGWKPDQQGPPKFADGDGYLIDTNRYCDMDTEPSRGGVILGGFFQGHDHYDNTVGQCTGFLDWGAIELSEAFWFGVRKFEKEIVSWSSLGKSSAGYAKQNVIGTYIRDTCSSLLMGVAQSQTLAQNSSVFESYAKNVSDTNYQAANLSSPDNLGDPCKPPLLMVIGPGSSAETATVSPLLSILKIPHISFWATSTQFNNIADYPYLFRTVPSDDHQVAALADIIEYFGWSYIILIAASDEIYSGRGVELLRQQALTRGTFCIAKQIRFTERDLPGMKEIALAIKAENESFVVVLFSPLAPARQMLEAMLLVNVTGRVILGSDDWVNRLGDKYHLIGNNALFGLTPQMIGNSRSEDWINEMRQEMDSFHEDHGRFQQTVEHNPWFKPYIEGALGCRLPQEFKSRCAIPLGKNVENTRKEFSVCDLLNLPWSSPPMQRAEPLMRAMEVAGKVIVHAVYEDKDYTIDADKNFCNYPRGDVMLRQLQNMTMPCDDNPSGHCLVFNEFQGGWPVYKIRNWNHDTKTLHVVGNWDGRRANISDRLTWRNDSEVDFSPPHGLHTPNSPNKTNVPKSTCSRTCQPGERRVFHLPQVARCCWRCIKCEEETASGASNSDECTICKLGERANLDQSACLMINADRLSFSNPWGATITAFALLGAAGAIFTLTVFWRFRTCYLVRASDLYLTTAILTGVILGQLLSLLLLAEPTEVTCRATPILTVPWPILTSAGILVKTNRFNRIFAATTRLQSHSRSKRLLLSTIFQLGVIAGLTAISLLLGVIQLLVNPPEPKKTYPDSNTVYLICSTSSFWIATSLAYLVLLLCICAILAFQTRKLPDNYNDAKLVAMAAFTTCVVWLGFSPAVFITESSFRPVIVAIALIAQMWAVWACLYAPRLIPMLRSQEIRMSTKPKSSSNNMPGNVRLVTTKSYSSQSAYSSERTELTVNT